jgi:uncharacterized membrane protein YdjX (TVP38/TMEM64 family)
MPDSEPIPRRRVAEPQPKPGFRWRIIPAWFLMIFGGALTGMYALLILPLHFNPQNIQQHIRQSGAAVLMCVAGVCWFAAGRAILAGRWKWMLLLLAIGYVCGASGAHLLSG